MKFKMKAAVAALAMMAAGGANAAINPGSAYSAPGVGELYFSVWDSVNQISYSRDLGVTINQFMADPTASMNFSADSTLQSFISTANASGSSLVWNLVGAMDTDFGDPTVWPEYGLYLTSNSSAANINAIDFTQASNGILDIGKQTAGINGDAQMQGGGSSTDYALNNSSTSTSGNGYYASPTVGGNNLGTQILASGTSDEAKIGESMAFYQIGLAFDASGNPMTDSSGSLMMTPTKFGNWTLATNGDLSYGVVGTAPVPLPPAVLLLGSALAGLVGVSRRRQQDEALPA